MAWTVVVFAIPSQYRSIEDLPDGFEPEPLGSKSYVQSSLIQVYPDVSFTSSNDDSYAHLSRQDFSIEFSLGDDADTVDALGLRIHGADSVIDAIQDLCEHTGWRAYDTSMGEFIDFQRDSAEGLRGWRNFADKVIGRDREPKGYYISSHRPEILNENQE